MAPALIDSPSPPLSEERVSTVSATGRPKLYIIDKLHPAAISHAQQLFEQRDAEYLIVKSSSITSSQIADCTRLRAIGKQGVGLDKIDLDACQKAGVRVFNTPGVNAGSVAELVLGLTMAVARQIGSIQVRQRAGELVQKETCGGQTLRGKKLALIGMGNISRQVARIFRGAFDVEIVAYDPFAPPDTWQDVAHLRVDSVMDALRGADVVSVHVPLTEATRNLIGLNEMRLLKPSSIIINAARGGIISEEDLVVALEDGTVWGAGLDCHLEEPPSQATYGRLWLHPRVVSTPHIGAATSETQRDTAKAAIDHVYRFSVT